MLLAKEKDPNFNYKRNGEKVMVGKNYKRRDIHTRPELAGEHNLPPEKIKRDKIKTADQEEASQLMGSLTELFLKGTDPKQKRSAWDGETLRNEIGKYFMYCDKHILKPTKSALGLWLAVSRETYNRWSKDVSNNEIYDIMEQANIIIENQYVNRGEKHPAFNTFMLKAQCGYVEKQEVVVENKNASEEDVQEAIKKLGIK